METQKYIITKTSDLPEKSAKEIEIEIPASEISQYRQKALREIGASVELPGFRKGKAPEEMIVKHFGEVKILEEAIEIFAKETVPEILAKEAPETIATPRIAVKKAVPGNPVTLSIFAPLKPKITLPDYKKIASGINKKDVSAIEISDKEIEESILKIRKHFANLSKNNKGENVAEKDLPELSDEFVAKLGDFKNVDDFKTRLKNDLLEDKKMRAKEKRRLDILSKIIDEAKGAIPDALIEYELDKMEMEFEDDLEKMNVKMADYLKNINKTADDIRKDWRSMAEKRIRSEIVLREIVLQENIEADKSLVEKETTHLLEHHKDVDPLKAKSYVENILVKQKVFEWLENQS